MKVADGGGFKCIYVRTVHKYNDVLNCTIVIGSHVYIHV